VQPALVCMSTCDCLIRFLVSEAICFAAVSVVCFKCIVFLTAALLNKLWMNFLNFERGNSQRHWLYGYYRLPSSLLSHSSEMAPFLGDVRKRIAVCATSTTPLRELTYHMGSHSITCHPAEVTFPPLPQPIKTGTRFSDPRGMQG